VTAKTQTPKIQSQIKRFFIVDASECNASKIQSFITLIQFIKYDDDNAGRIIVRHEDNEFPIKVLKQFSRAMAYTIAEILDKLNRKECTLVKEIDRW